MAKTKQCKYCGKPIDGRSCSCTQARKDYAAKLYAKYYGNERGQDASKAVHKKVKAYYRKQKQEAMA